MPNLDIPKIDITSPDIPFPVMTSGVPQVVYGKTGEPIVFHPRNIGFIQHPTYSSSIFKRVENFPEFIKNFRTILIARTYALGDMLMILPVVRYLQKKYPEKEIRLLTDPKWLKIFQDTSSIKVQPFFKGTTWNCPPHEILINFDECTFECDHCEAHPFHVWHRTDIAYFLLGVPDENRIYDYSLTISDNTRKSIITKLTQKKIKSKEYVYFSWRGSNSIKTFPISTRKHLIQKLAEKIPVVIGDKDPSPEGQFACSNVYWICGSNLIDTLAFIEQSKFVLTTDSGPLWMAHIAKTPVACYLGPTTEETRLNKHPLYQQGLCKKIELKDLVGCPEVCYHNLRWCERKIKCLQEVDVNRLWERTESVLTEMKMI